MHSVRGNKIWDEKQEEVSQLKAEQFTLVSFQKNSIIYIMENKFSEIIIIIIHPECSKQVSQAFT